MGFCKPDQKSMPVVGLLTRNDCDVLRAKTGLYRRVTPRTIIPPTTGWTCFSHAESQSLMAAGEMTLVMRKGPAHLWSNFFIGWSDEKFRRLIHTLSPTCYSVAA